MKTEKKGRTPAARKGNAALCAILIMIMLLAVGTALLVVMGETPIHANESMPSYMSITNTSSAADTSSESIPEPVPEALMEYPDKGMEFMPMELKEISAKYNVLLGVTDNTLYTGKNYTKKAYPASLTKIMTVIVALEKVDDLSATYKFTKEDMQKLENENASVAGFSAGEKVTIRDLLYGAMLPSGADATLGLANYVAGSEDAFVDMMNDKVEELGLENTHFENASGLHDPNHFSTALDMAMLVKYAIDNPDISNDFLKIIGAKNYKTKKSNKHKEGITLSSIFFQRYDGFFVDRDSDNKEDCEIVGGKTGFTDESKYSLASVYKIGENYYVCITMKSDNSSKATEDNIRICERYLPVNDLAGTVERGPESSSSSSSEEDSSSESAAEDDSSSHTDDSSESSSSVKLDQSAIDTTPSVIDQTESTDDSSDAAIITDNGQGNNDGTSPDQQGTELPMMGT
ncbi:MAG: serine hydrolase [Ruminococcus sp.]|nr:serine hydrolase [Ruminococcus sp.]